MLWLANHIGQSIPTTPSVSRGEPTGVSSRCLPERSYPRASYLDKMAFARRRTERNTDHVARGLRRADFDKTKTLAPSSCQKCGTWRAKSNSPALGIKARNCQRSSRMRQNINPIRLPAKVAVRRPVHYCCAQTVEKNKFVEWALTVIETCRVQKHSMFPRVTQPGVAHMA